MTERLSGARLREIVVEHVKTNLSSNRREIWACGRCFASWPCETRQMAEELIERRRQEADWLAEALEGHRD